MELMQLTFFHFGQCKIACFVTILLRFRSTWKASSDQPRKQVFKLQFILSLILNSTVVSEPLCPLRLKSAKSYLKLCLP